MAFDRKYGQIETEFGNFGGDDEQVVIFRAHDLLLPELLKSYHILCSSTNSPREHLEQIEQTYQEIVAWQQANPDKVRVPTSAGHLKRMKDERS